MAECPLNGAFSGMMWLFGSPYSPFLAGPPAVSILPEPIAGPNPTAAVGAADLFESGAIPLWLIERLRGGGRRQPPPAIAHSLFAGSAYFDGAAGSSGQRKREGETPVIKASSAALIAGVGMVRLLGTRRGNIYDCRLIFPNLKVLEFSVTVDSKGNITIPNGGEGLFRDPATSRVQRVRITKVPDASGIIDCDFGTSSLRLKLTTTEPEKGDAVIGVRLSLQTAQDAVDGTKAAPFITVVRPTAEKVTAVNLDMVGSSLVRGTNTQNMTDKITLSNGDVIELVTNIDHHAKGGYRVLSARLNSFAGGEPDSWVDLKVADGEGKGEGRIRIEGAGYDIEIPVTAPTASMGSRLRFTLERIRVIKSPEPAFAPTIQTVVDFSRDVVNPLAGISLVPDAQSASQMRYPPWDGRPVDLAFTGEIGGRRITAERALVIRGHFVEGRFVPDIAGNQKRMYVFPADSKGPLEVVLSSGKAGVSIQVPLASAGFMEAGVIEGDGLIGFGTDPALLKGKLTDVFIVKELTAVGRFRQGDREKAPPMIWSEAARFIARSAAPWNEPGTVLVGKADPSLVTVVLNGGRELLFKRRVTTEGSIDYEVINPGQPGTRLGCVRLGEMADCSIEGLEETNASGSARFKPWPGELRGVEWATGRMEFADEAMPSLRVSLDLGAEARMKFRLMRPSAEGNFNGVMSKTETNGRTALIFHMEDGNELRIGLPEGMSAEDGIITLAISPDSAGEQQMTVEERDVSGQVARRGRLAVINGEWVFEDESGRQKALIMDVNRSRAPSLRLASPSPPVFVIPTAEEVAAQLKTAEAPGTAEPQAPAPPAETPPAEAPPKPALSPAGPAPISPRARPYFLTPPPQVKSFPWEEGIFVSPSRATRGLMRAQFETEGRPEEGRKAQFEFYGDPVSPDNMRSAKTILARMERHGKDSWTFFGWIVRVDMVFKNGQWVPDKNGALHMERRFPRLEHGRVAGFFEVPALNGDYPLRVVPFGTGWGISAGAGRIIQPFRVVLKEGGSAGISPDFALSMGEPADEAREHLKMLEHIERVRPAGIAPRLAERLSVDAQFGGDISARITPDFGDPIYRTHADVHGNVSIVEFAPGYSALHSEARFTKLHVHDGNGFSWVMVFQHGEGARARLIAADSGGRPIALGSIDVLEVEDGKFWASGIVQTGVSLRSGTDGSLNLPFEIEWSDRGGTFEISTVKIGDDHFELEGLKFNPESWKAQDIFKPRDGQELNVKVTRVAGRTGRTGGRPVVVDAPPPASDQIEVMVPDNLRELAYGEGPLKEAVPVTYRQADGTGLKIRVRWNAMHTAYEPVEEGGVTLVTVKPREGRPHSLAVRCQATETGRHWRLAVHEGANLYLGNFYVNETEDGGRPIPVLWSSSGADPHRPAVVRIMEDRGLAPRPTGGHQLNPRERSEFRLHFEVRGNRYEVPMRSYPQPNGKIVVAPSGPAVRSTEGGKSIRALNFYLPTRGSPASIEVDGIAFDLEIRGSGLTGGQKLLLRHTHPGASALYQGIRSRSSVMLEPNDQSALLLLDLNAESFVDAVKDSRSAEGPRIVRRVLRDAVSGRVYELAFEVKPDAHGQDVLVFKGMAMLTQTGAEVISGEAMEAGGRIYFRTSDGHYLSFSRYPSGSLGVSSHGRTLSAELVRRYWDALVPDVGLFSASFSEPEPETPAVSRAFDTEADRIRARNTVADNFGVERDVVWDTQSTYPKGIIFEAKTKDQDMSRPLHRIFNRGHFEIEADLDRGLWTPERISVRYRGEDIPIRRFDYAGRPYFVLGGPLSGVVLYWYAVRKGLVKIVEISHPAIREQLDRDRGVEPMPRPRFKPDRTGHVYLYPEVEGALKEAIERQVSRSRLWRLGMAGVLPETADEQLELSRKFIPDPEGYSEAGRSSILVALEEISETEAYRPQVAVILAGLADGDIDISGPELRKLKNALADYKEASSWAEGSEAFFDEFTGALHGAVEKVETTRQASSKPPVRVLRARDAVAPAPAGAPAEATVRNLGQFGKIVREVYGAGTVAYLEIDKTPIENLDNLSARVKEKLGSRWQAVEAAITAQERQGKIPPAQYTALLLEALERARLHTAYRKQSGEERFTVFEATCYISDLAQRPERRFSPEELIRRVVIPAFR